MDGREAAAAQVSREHRGGRKEEVKERKRTRGEGELRFFLFFSCFLPPGGGGSRMKYLNNKVLVS